MRYGPLAGLLFLGLLWIILCRHLSGEWSVNEQYSYGWFVPFFAAYLFWLRWEDKPKLEIRNSKLEKQPNGLLLSTLAFLLLAALLPIRLFEVGNPDWRPLSWIHALIVVALTLAVIWRVGGVPWLRHFAFPVCFILVAVPWVTPIEAPIVQGLMSTVAAVATETLHLFGIPAQLEGSLIRVSTGLVGVNEACSGVRSLQTSIMIGLLFGELKRLSVWRRVALLAGALGIALVANFGRAFTLVWISATRSPEAANSWHDGLGYAIVGLVFVGSIAIAAALARGQESGVGGRKSDDAADAGRAVRLPSHSGPLNASPFRLFTLDFLLPLVWLVSVEMGVEAWYRVHERSLVGTQQWTVQYPEDAPGFREIEIDEQVQSTLRYDTGRQVAWNPSLPADEPLPPTIDRSRLTNNGRSAATAFLFFFRWEPGTSTILRARSHRPDVCLPNVGWKQSGDFGVREYEVSSGARLPFRHFAFRRQLAGQPPAFAHSFFCMREDKVRGDRNGAFDLTADEQTSNWMANDRIRVVREGLRNPGQQVMQMVLITPSELPPEVAEGRFRELLPQIVRLGDEKPKS
jgi:exosortase